MGNEFFETLGMQRDLKSLTLTQLRIVTKHLKIFLGECFATADTSKYRVDGVFECSQRCVRVKTCVGIRY